jgi:hypothetical protein
VDFGPISPLTKLPTGKLANTGHVNRAIAASNANRRLFHHGQIDRGRIHGAIVPVRLISVLVAGKYNAKLFSGPLRTDLATAIDDTQIGTEADDVDAIAWNVSEAGSGSALSVGADSDPVMCKVLDVNADGKVVVVILGGAGGTGALPPGGDQYMVVQKASSADGDYVVDWVRAHS